MADGDSHYAEVAGAGKLSLVHIRVCEISILENGQLSGCGETPSLIEWPRFYSQPETRLPSWTAVGGIDLELAPQVVTALDDVCVLSPRSFDTPSLTALLGEVCLWLVEQRIGPRAQHAKYRSCDPYAQVRLFTGWQPCAGGGSRHRPGRFFPGAVSDYCGFGISCLRNRLTFSVLFLLLCVLLLVNRCSTN